MFSMKVADPWAEIIGEALKRGTANGAAIAGARLRDLVSKVAIEKGRKYPPSDEPNLKFGQFLERYAKSVVVLHRPGQDLLVAPASSPSFLIETYGRSGIRKDLFDAFTRIDPDKLSWYDPTTDSVAPRPRTAAAMAAPFVRIPSPTLDDALLFRQRFADGQPDPAIRERLNNSLQARTLGSFTVEIREIGLRRQWHLFRTKELANRIAQWAAESKIPWGDSWLQALPQRSDTNAPEQSLGDDLSLESTTTQDFGELLQALSPEDLSRITVPLDLVLKTLRKRS